MIINIIKIAGIFQGVGINKEKAILNIIKLIINGIPISFFESFINLIEKDKSNPMITGITETLITYK
jgi:hypothetical protein